MNWTGGQLRRIKGDRLSAKSRERLIQMQFIRDNEMKKVMVRMDKMSHQLKDNEEVMANSGGQGLATDGSDYRSDKHLNKEFLAKHLTRFDSNEELIQRYVKTDAEEEYFKEVLNDLFWKYESKDK